MIAGGLREGPEIVCFKFLDRKERIHGDAVFRPACIADRGFPIPGIYADHVRTGRLEKMRDAVACPAGTIAEVPDETVHRTVRSGDKCDRVALHLMLDRYGESRITFGDRPF